VSLESDSNIKREIVQQLAKQYARKILTLFGIITSLTPPKYFVIVSRSKSIKQSPQILKLGFSGAIQIACRFVSNNAQQSIWRSAGGRVIEESDEQFLNTNCSIRKSFELDSNVIVESDWQSSKQCPPRFSTEEGMQIAKTDEQCRKQDAPM
jgi:hypothetical protein